ncbi:protein-export chaperone SecB [Blastochloris sulfoviridis]|uniref:Protein-export protein SecB n=1 Tax=Blastochloris sulfoviridis TaxID=50712 RepID=A0A5M6HX18_9HYPH|nr:protein-export chaperone SecB [Blastochloris sulfoviridis]KAA5600416.1 protein-export chaperone SecB [Blastochloris sulfoviridis]
MNTTANGAPTESKAPGLNVLAQFIKDFSFENPNAPQSLVPPPQPPSINVQINVTANPLSATDYNVDLKIEGTAQHENTVLFSFDLSYGGVFRVHNIAPEAVHPVVLIECPRLLFPFARQIIAEAVRNGGFPPLLLEPVDFAALYRQRLAELQAASPTPPAA